MTMRAKLVFGSMSPVISSTLSICCLMRSLTRSKRPSAGQLVRRRNSHVSIRESGAVGRHRRGTSILKQLRRRALGDPGARQSLKIASLGWDGLRGGINLAQDIVDVHGEVSSAGGPRITIALGLFPRILCLIMSVVVFVIADGSSRPIELLKPVLVTYTYTYTTSTKHVCLAGPDLARVYPRGSVGYVGMWSRNRGGQDELTQACERSQRNTSATITFNSRYALSFVGEERIGLKCTGL